MPKPDFIARQSAHPRGLFGHLVARVMARDTAAANAWVLKSLEAKPGEHILELGCGHGRALRQVSSRVGAGRVLGVDPSKVMRAVAERHNRRAIGRGKVRIADGDARSIPAEDDCFDKAFSVHTLYFWPDFDAGLRELHRVLRRGGELFLAFHAGENLEVARALPADVYKLQTTEQVETALRRAGFAENEISIEPKTALRLARARK
jgi:ubiquinone/menaquinone biosynthesis C-methylase UbiE